MLTTQRARPNWHLARLLWPLLLSLAEQHRGPRAAGVKLQRRAGRRVDAAVRHARRDRSCSSSSTLTLGPCRASAFTARAALASACPRLLAVVVLLRRAARRMAPTAPVSSPSRCALRPAFALRRASALTASSIELPAASRSRCSSSQVSTRLATPVAAPRAKEIERQCRVCRASRGRRRRTRDAGLGGRRRCGRVGLRHGRPICRGPAHAERIFPRARTNAAPALPGVLIVIAGGAS